VLVEVDELPSWYSSIRFRGMGSWNGGWLRVVGFFCLCKGSGVVMIPIALWSPYSGVRVVIVMFMFV
jgi:hypothetical protein